MDFGFSNQTTEQGGGANELTGPFAPCAEGATACSPVPIAVPCIITCDNRTRDAISLMRVAFHFIR